MRVLTVIAELPPRCVQHRAVERPGPKPRRRRQGADAGRIKAGTHRQQVPNRNLAHAGVDARLKRLGQEVAEVLVEAVECSLTECDADEN